MRSLHALRLVEMTIGGMVEMTIDVISSEAGGEVEKSLLS